MPPLKARTRIVCGLFVCGLEKIVGFWHFNTFAAQVKYITCTFVLSIETYIFSHIKFHLHMKNKIDFKIPAWLVPIICNDDWTATNDADEKAAKDFFAKTYFDWGTGYWVVNEDTGFGLNDVDNFAGDTYAATYVADGFLSRSTATESKK